MGVLFLAFLLFCGQPKPLLSLQPALTIAVLLASSNYCSLVGQLKLLLSCWPALTVAVLLASSYHCCLIGQRIPLLSCWPALTIAVFTTSSNCFFTFIAAALAVALLLGGLVSAPAYPGTACEMRPLFACSPGPCLAASSSSFCYILST